MFIVEYLFNKKLWSIYTVLRLRPENPHYSLLNIYLGYLIGGFSHIFLDMFVHQTMPYVVYPLAIGNPFYLGTASIIVELLAVALSIVSIYFWIKTAKTNKKHKTKKAFRVPLEFPSLSGNFVRTSGYRPTPYS